MRKDWKNNQYFRTIFGKTFSDNHIDKLKKKLSKLPEQDEYKIVAYGSLMKESDISRTIQNYSIEPGYIKGWQRIFNVGTKGYGSYLNVAKLDNSKYLMPVGIITCSWHDIPEYLMREGLYEPEMVEYYIDGELQEDKAITVVSIWDDVGLEPQLNYVHHCLNGIIDLHGNIGAKDFIDNTICYDPMQAGLGSLKDWLGNMNVADYMLRNEYLKR